MTAPSRRMKRLKKHLPEKAVPQLTCSSPPRNSVKVLLNQPHVPNLWDSDRRRLVPPVSHRIHSIYQYVGIGMEWGPTSMLNHSLLKGMSRDDDRVTF